MLRVMLASVLVFGACTGTDGEDKSLPKGSLILTALDPELGIQGTFASTEGVTLAYSITRTTDSVTGFVKDAADVEIARFTFTKDSVAMSFNGVAFAPNDMKNPTPQEVAFSRSPNGLALRELGRVFSMEAAEDEALAAKLKDFQSELGVFGMVTNMGNMVDPGGLYMSQRPTGLSPYADSCQGHSAPTAWYLQDGHQDQMSDDLRPGYYGAEGPCFGLCGAGCSYVIGTGRYTNSCYNHDWVTANDCGGSHWNCFLLGYNNPFSSNYWNPYGGFGCAANSAIGGTACSGGKLGS